MNRKKLEEWLKDISTPTGLSYSGDRTLSNSEVDTILEYVDNLQYKIDKAIEYIYETKESNSFTRLPSGKITDIGYCLVALEDIEDILKEDK